jgi:methylphosphotriester-DNA--protein-cysteine methyltransferase
MRPSNASHMYQTSHARWSAISQRDAAAHCSFVYGVRTTGIYCRPTCTARLARRANVVFYDNIDQARGAGFRACQKCKPDDVAFYGQREEVVVKAIEILRTKQNDASMKWSLKELAKQVGVTPSYLCRVFKKTMGTTIGEYMRQFEVQTDAAAIGELMISPCTTDTTMMSSECQSPGSEVVLSRSRIDNSGARTTLASQIPGTTHSCGLVPSVEPYIRDEEAFDIDFDFDEWVWTEGLNFDQWVSNSDNSYSSTSLNV